MKSVFPGSAGRGSRPGVFPRILRDVRPALTIMALGVLGAFYLGCAGSRRPVSPTPAKIDSDSARIGGAVPSSPGPWGELVVIRMSTEPPEEYVAQHYDSEVARWYFPDEPRDQIDALFKAAGLDDARRQALWKSAQPNPLDAGWTFNPDADLLLSLTPQSRRVIYLALAKYKQNVYKSNPFRWRAAALDEWFADGGMSDATISLIRKLLYFRGQSALFADPELLLATLPDRKDRIQALKTLSRQSTLLVKLKIRPDTDVAALTAYWGGHNRSRDIAALLESLAKVPGGCDLDIIHLLPRFARVRLYSYPSRAIGKIEHLYDCHWTSMNFWSDPPDDRMEDPQYRAEALNRDYHRVPGPSKLGDLLFLTVGGEEKVHSAVYIADDIVFTKNGTSATSPWMLMKLDRMLAYYEKESDLQVAVYRLNHE